MESHITGFTKKHGRSTLVEKTLIPINPNMSVAKQARDFEDTLMRVYGEIKRIFFVGDGANWITTFKNNMKFSEASRYINQFHYRKYVKDMLWRKAKVNWKYLLTLKKDAAIFYLLMLVIDQWGEVHMSQSKLLPKVKKDSFHERDVL